MCITAMFVSTTMDALAKFATTDASTWQMVFLRWSFGLLFLAPPMIIKGRRDDWNIFKRIHLERAVLGVVGSLSLFYALAHLKLAIAITIFFTEPLITVIFAALILRESVSAIRWICTILAFVAVAFATMPAKTDGWSSVINLYAATAFIAPFCWGLIRVLSKRAQIHTSTKSMLFWSAVSTLGAATPFALSDWQPLEHHVYFVMFGVAALGSVYSAMMLYSLKLVSANYVANFFYLLLPLSFIAGYVFFGEIPLPRAYVGAALVLVLVFVATHRPTEKRLGQWLLPAKREPRI